MFFNGLMRNIKSKYNVLFQNFEYNLGCGMKTSNLKEAGELLMKREYPDIFNCQEKDHGYLFIPDIFMYEELTKKVKFTEIIFSTQTQKLYPVLFFFVFLFLLLSLCICYLFGKKCISNKMS